MVRNQSPVNKAYSKLLRQILSGKLRSGEKLREQKLCSEFDVSRTPLREALMRLVQDGLVEKVPRYGCQVREFSPQQITELFECRSVLEPAALRLAAQYIDRAALDSVLAVLDSVEGADDERSASVLADKAMHSLATDFCPNKQMVSLIEGLQLRTAAYRNYRAYKIADLSVASSERYDIVNTIKAGKIDEAAKMLEVHIMRGVEALGGE